MFADFLSNVEDGRNPSIGIMLEIGMLLLKHEVEQSIRNIYKL